MKLISIQDKFNPSKTHVFKAMKDGHLFYNQAIHGKLFYHRFERINHLHGYYDIFTSYMTDHKLPSIKSAS